MIVVTSQDEKQKEEEKENGREEGEGREGRGGGRGGGGEQKDGYSSGHDRCDRSSPHRREPGAES